LYNISFIGICSRWGVPTTQSLVGDLVKEVNSINEIPGIKMLTGYNVASRIRSGDYRIGVFVSEDLVESVQIYPRRHRPLNAHIGLLTF